MIFVGGGAVISGAEKELKEFVYKVDAPVTDTLMGKVHLTAQTHIIQECLVCMVQRQQT